MKTLFSLVLVVLLAGTCMAQPPQRGHGKFGAGKGPFGDPAKMAEMRQKMMERRQSEDTPDVQRHSGPPPWAGRYMMQRGPRGPQHPFRGQGAQKGIHLRGSSPAAEVRGSHHGHRGRGWQHRDQESETKRGGSQKQNNRSVDKKCRGESCACPDCPNNK